MEDWTHRLLQNNKADLFTVSKLLGHTSVTTTEKYYVDLIDKNYRDSVKGLDNLFWEKLKTKYEFYKIVKLFLT